MLGKTLATWEYFSGTWAYRGYFWGIWAYRGVFLVYLGTPGGISGVSGRMLGYFWGI